MNNVIEGTDNDVDRIRLGKTISRPTNKKYILKSKQRGEYKQKLQDGIFTPLQYLAAITRTIATSSILSLETQLSDISDDDDDNGDDDEITVNQGICTVCRGPRIETWIFMPCRHATFCTTCNNTIEELDQSCLLCRCRIESRFQI